MCLLFVVVVHLVVFVVVRVVVVRVLPCCIIKCTLDPDMALQKQSTSAM